MNRLSDEIILRDNDHFEGEIIRYPIDFMFENFGPYETLDGKTVPIQQYRFYMNVGCTGNKWQACYIWDINSRQWTLGAN